MSTPAERTAHVISEKRTVEIPALPSSAQRTVHVLE